jgi:hypothetical protein
MRAKSEKGKVTGQINLAWSRAGSGFAVVVGVRIMLRKPCSPVTGLETNSGSEISVLSR